MPYHVPFHTIDALGWAFKADGAAKHTTIQFGQSGVHYDVAGGQTRCALAPLLLSAASENGLNDRHIKTRKVTALVHLGARGNSEGSRCHDDRWIALFADCVLKTCATFVTFEACHEKWLSTHAL